LLFARKKQKQTKVVRLDSDWRLHSRQREVVDKGSRVEKQRTKRVKGGRADKEQDQEIDCFAEESWGDE
jgi:hypothetical protein